MDAFKVETLHALCVFTVFLIYRISSAWLESRVHKGDKEKHLKKMMCQRGINLKLLPNMH